MCIQWTRGLYSVVVTRQSNPPISQFNRPCNEFTIGWPMFVYNTHTEQWETAKHSYNYRLRGEMGRASGS